MSEFEVGRELERALARIAECERLIADHQTLHAGLPDYEAKLAAVAADLAEAAADLAAMQAEMDEAIREPEPEPEPAPEPEPFTEADETASKEIALRLPPILKRARYALSLLEKEQLRDAADEFKHVDRLVTLLAKDCA